jgi:hypothetical protein
MESLLGRSRPVRAHGGRCGKVSRYCQKLSIFPSKNKNTMNDMPRLGPRKMIAAQYKSA